MNDELTVPQSPSRTRQVVSFSSKLLGHKKALAGLLLLGPILTLTILSPVISPHDPTNTNPTDQFADPGGKFLLGTDNLGRDLLSRTLLGGRTSLFLGVTSVMLGLIAGIPLGMSAAYFGGRIDEGIMRLMDVLISVPTLLLALLILTALGSSVWNAIMAIAIVNVPRLARVIRGSTLSVKEEAFVQAAQARGESHLYVMFVEILPNISAPIVVETSVRIGYAILVGSTLSFLGLGAQPPTPDWGYMIDQARNFIWNTPWYLIWPSMALGLSVLGFNLLGDGLRDVLDVKE